MNKCKNVRRDDLFLIFYLRSDLMDGLEVFLHHEIYSLDSIIFCRGEFIRCPNKR